MCLSKGTKQTFHGIRVCKKGVANSKTSGLLERRERAGLHYR